MTNHLDIDTLSDFAEGRLPEARRPGVVDHLAACTECREEVAWIRELRERVAELPEEREPPGDQWPEIERRIRAARPERGSSRARDVRPRFGGLASRSSLLRAAAVILLAGLPAGAVYLMTSGPAPLVDRGDSPSGRLGTSGGDIQFVGYTPEAVAAAYEPAIRDLRALLEEERDRLHPETVAVLEENLRIIDRAIDDFFEALRDDPAGIDAGRMLNGMYETKIRLLRQATSLTRGA